MTHFSILANMTPFDVELNIIERVLNEVNVTLDTTQNMIIHQLNLSDTTAAVLISVYPRENYSLTVVADFNENLNENDYSIKFKVWQ